MSRKYNIRKAASDLADAIITEFKANKPVTTGTKQGNHKDGHFYQVEAKISVGTKFSPIGGFATETLEPFENNDNIFIYLASTENKNDKTYAFVRCTDIEDLKYKLKDFFYENWYYIEHNLTGGLFSSREYNMLNERHYLHHTKRKEIIDKIVKAYIEGFNDYDNNIVHYNTDHYISYKGYIDIGYKEKLLIKIESQDLMYYENKSDIYVEMSNDNMPLGKAAIRDIKASNARELKGEITKFVEQALDYVLSYMTPKGTLGESRSSTDNNIHEMSKSIATELLDMVPYNFLKKSISRTLGNGMTHELHTFLVNNPEYDTVYYKNDYIRGEITIKVADESVTFEINKNGVYDDVYNALMALLPMNKIHNSNVMRESSNKPMKGVKGNNKYMKESSSFNALMAVAEVIVDDAITFGDKGKISFYDALPYDYYGSLRDFVGNTEGYSYINYKLGDETDGEGGTKITLTVGGKSWDTFIYIDEGSSVYNAETVAEALENLLPSSAMSESRRRASSRSYYRK